MSNYLELLKQLSPKQTQENGYNALDLFAGCGGLALGFEAAGFKTVGYEIDEDAANTYNTNLNGSCNKEYLTDSTVFPDADIVIGGPPCQPFSVGGKQRGLTDSRDGFPAFISAIEQVRPRLWMFENVRGMMYKNREYLNEIVKTLESLGYHIKFEIAKAVDYQVPQNRERLIVIGYEGIFNFPPKSSNRFNAGDAISDIAYSIDDSSRFLTKSQDEYIAKYEKASKCINPRDLYMDRPSRTVTCRNLAGATGDMLRIKMPDGRRKRLSVREGARLQSFPDWFQFSGSENSQFNQVGNAVPPMMAYHLANSVLACLNNEVAEHEANRQMAFL